MRAKVMLLSLFAGAAIAGVATTTYQPVGAYSNPYSCPSKPLLVKGDKGTCVKRVQWFLKHGTDRSQPITGYFGSVTDKNVKKLETRSGIAVNGIVGPHSWRELERSVSNQGRIERPATQPVSRSERVAPAPASNSRIVSIAASQVGVREVPMGSDGGAAVHKYTTGRNEPWCADFVSWVYKEAGRPFNGGWAHSWQIPAVRDLKIWMRQKGQWHTRTSGTTPRPGDVVAFNWRSNPNSYRNNHVGIVERVEGSTLHTIEGNSSNRVERNVYRNYKANTKIIGWGNHR